MAKYGAIIPTCFLLASGCALLDTPEMATEPPAMSVAVIENEAAPAPAVEARETKPVEPPASARRRLTNNDVRRLQERLRDIGFEPGPMDGIAGARTKAAYGRLHRGCGKVSTLIAKLHEPDSATPAFSGNASRDKLLGRAEMRHLQSQLREAGFDPGPVDGIFGVRTKSIIARLQSACLLAKEFEGILADDLASAINHGNISTVPTSASIPPSDFPSTGVTAHDMSKPVAASTPSRSRVAIRILQLRLRDAGFDPGPFDGIMGPKTKLALEQYEASQRDRKVKTSLTRALTGGQY